MVRESRSAYNPSVAYDGTFLSFSSSNIEVSRMNRSKLLSVIAYVITACVFLMIFVWGIVNTVSGDEGFSIVSFWLIIPSVSLVGGFVLGYSGTKMKWLYPFVFGVCTSIIVSFIYSFQAINILYAFFSFAPALLSMSIGHILMKMVTVKKSSDNNSI